MSRRARRSVVGVLSTLAALVIGASLAWACTPAAYLFLSETGGDPGATISVTGKQFAPGPVEIEWTGAAGAPSTMAKGPSFSVSIAVPDLEPGVYYLQATAVDDFGGIEGQATRAFRVNVPAPARTPGRTGAEPAPAPNGAPTAPGGRGGTQSRPAPEGVAPVAPPRAAPPAAIAPAAPAASAGATPARPSPREDGRAAVEAPFPPARAPSQESVAADLWSGFASGPNPSLLSAPAAATPASGSGSRLLGFGFLGAGLVAALGGLALAGLRHRRAPAQP